MPLREVKGGRGPKPLGRRRLANNAQSFELGRADVVFAQLDPVQRAQHGGERARRQARARAQELAANRPLVCGCEPPFRFCQADARAVLRGQPLKPHLAGVVAVIVGVDAFNAVPVGGAVDAAEESSTRAALASTRGFDGVINGILKLGRGGRGRGRARWGLEAPRGEQGRAAWARCKRSERG